MGMSKAERDLHRKLAARCFNDAWTYLEKRRRTRPDERRLLDLVHASSFHWSLVGSPENQAIAEWQISRAYAALRQPELAARYAEASLSTCLRRGLDEILCTAYDAMARAHAVAGRPSSARKYLKRARTQLERVAFKESDRAVFLDQIRDTERLVGRSERRRLTREPPSPKVP